jgi:hypothetical protein
MARLIAEFLLGFAGVYLAVGTAFACGFHARGLRRLDAAAAAAGFFFRALITPGAIALWPLLVFRGRRASDRAVPGSADPPTSARQLRRLHGVFIQMLAVLVPVAVGAALWFRPADRDATPAWPAGTSEPPALPEVLDGPARVFGALPVTASLRGGTGGERQVELAVEQDLEPPALALFWSRGGAAGRLPPKAVFLGSVWGPGVRRYAAQADAAAGHLHLVALSEGQRLIATAPMSAISPRKSPILD